MSTEASTGAHVDPGDLAPRHDVPRGGRSGFTVVGDRQVHYLEWGHRGLSPILCLHGGGQTAYMYEELGAFLGGRHHVLAPDMPTHGDSDPLPDFDMTRDALAASVTKAPAICSLSQASIIVITPSLSVSLRSQVIFGAAK